MSARRRAWLVAVGGFALWAAVGMALFVWLAARTYRWGFPLDDAWIHQTYARNLALWGEWAYRPGAPSAGATAPLWVLLQAMGQVLGVSPLVWSAGLGWATLTGLSVAAWAWWRRVFPQWDGVWPWAAGAVMGAAWHLVWAALSGMETLLFAAGMFVLALWAGEGWRDKRQAWLWGAAVGVMAWVRPEAILLLGVALAVEVAVARTWREAVKMVAGFAVVFLPYLALNYALAGHPWPNTFYAKQAEYAALRRLPWVRRAWRVGAPLLVGGGALLLPTGVWHAMAQAREGRWRRWIAPVWAVGHVGAYVVRLPVAYQHGRYVLPVLPVLLWFGLAGGAGLWSAWEGRLTGRWVVSRLWAAALAVTMGGFLVLGGRAYAQDVALIESEMVDTAQWMAVHLPPHTVVAAHDIGAVGYFTPFPLVDMAGLVSPQVIPFIRDEAALRAFLDRQGVEVLVVFPHWYRHLATGLPVLYFNPQGWGPRLGGEHMMVYRWR